MSQATRVETRFILQDDLARNLHSQLGTPLYVLDEAHVRDRVRRYWAAFRARAPKCELTYASKANSTLALLAIVASEGCLIDCASEGELRAALAAGVPASRCHLHGNAKTMGEIRFAAEVGVHQIVVDSFAEIEMLAQLEHTPELLIRLAPGFIPKTHAKISTGQDDTKFGFNIGDGSAERALRRCLELGFRVAGFHCHMGSQVLEPSAQIHGGGRLAEFAKQMRDQHGFETRMINVGGGLGIRYTDQDNPMGIEEYNAALVDAIRAALESTGLDPVLVQEPGRWIVGESGVTLYKVHVRKTVPSPQKGTRTYLAVDGGLSDNPRPALYGSKYEVRAIPADGRDLSQSVAPFTISGRHCETDKLFEDVLLPEDVREGDLLQVLCTGAYNSSMASNYNRYRRPATVLIRPNGTYELVQRPETWEEMIAREWMPVDLG